MASEVEIIGEIERVERIAKGAGVALRKHLNRLHGKRSWRKWKGIATVRLPDGALVRAEVHWFEGHGVGKVDMKIKRILSGRP